MSQARQIVAAGAPSTTRPQAGVAEPNELDLQLRFGVVAVAGEVDTLSAPRLAAVLAPLVAHGGPVRINLRDVTFIDAAGIGVLAGAAASICGRGHIVVLDPAPTALRVIDIVGLREAIDVRPPLRH